MINEEERMPRCDSCKEPMTNKEILEKAIQKAIEGGWRRSWMGAFQGITTDVITGEMFVRYQCKGLPSFQWSLFGLIYFHDFAKALWGEELHHETFIIPKELSSRFAGTTNLDIRPIWQWHLQQMVIAEDPIKYLGENL